MTKVGLKPQRAWKILTDTTFFLEHKLENLGNSSQILRTPRTNAHQFPLYICACHVESVRVVLTVPTSISDFVRALRAKQQIKCDRSMPLCVCVTEQHCLYNVQCTCVM